MYLSILFMFYLFIPPANWGCKMWGGGGVGGGVTIIKRSGKSAQSWGGGVCGKPADKVKGPIW